MGTRRNTSRVGAYVRDAYCSRPQDYIRYRLSKGTHAEDSLAPLVTRTLTNLAGDDATIMDIGCGFDPVMACVPHRRYIGLDLSEALMKRHPLYGTPGAEFHQTDIRYCHFERFPYHVINGTLILNYIRDPSGLLHRLRRPGKGFCFSVPNPEFDQQFGTLNGNGVVSLVMNRYRFDYYFHPLPRLRAALRRPRYLSVAYTPEIADGIPPFYVCLYGRW